MALAEKTSIAECNNPGTAAYVQLRIPTPRVLPSLLGAAANYLLLGGLVGVGPSESGMRQGVSAGVGESLPGPIMSLELSSWGPGIGPSTTNINSARRNHLPVPSAGMAGTRTSALMRDLGHCDGDLHL